MSDENKIHPIKRSTNVEVQETSTRPINSFKQQILFFTPRIEKSIKENTYDFMEWLHEKGENGELSPQECAMNMAVFTKIYLQSMQLDLKYNLSDQEALESINFTKDLENFKRSD